ncbi:MAG: hypothetical protein WBO92_05175 [Candidatus Moraniibacteriota bacterium]
MFETPPTPEGEIQEATVIEALRNSQDLVNCEPYHRWRSQEENRIDALGNSMEENVRFILKDARLRRQAGLEDMAQLAFGEAVELLEGLGDSTMVEQVTKEMQG